MGNFAENRILYLKDIDLQSYYVNGMKIDRVIVPEITDVETSGVATIDQIFISFRDEFGHRSVSMGESGRFIFYLFVRGVKVVCSATYFILDGNLLITSIQEV